MAHFWPFLYAVPPGYITLVLVSFMLEYSEANLPSVALFPASELVLGAMSRTPLPVVVRPLGEPEAVAGRAGSAVPQMSMARPACQVCPPIGATAVVCLV